MANRSTVAGIPLDETIININDAALGIQQMWLPSPKPPAQELNWGHSPTLSFNNTNTAPIYSSSSLPPLTNNLGWTSPQASEYHPPGSFIDRVVQAIHYKK
jgi:hypothetical protein